MPDCICEWPEGCGGTWFLFCEHCGAQKPCEGCEDCGDAGFVQAGDANAWWQAYCRLRRCG